MKEITNYINEKLIIRRDYKRYTPNYKYYPKDTKDLANIIKQFIEIEERAPYLDLNSIDTSNIDNMGYLFYGENKIKRIDISHWNISNVYTMSYMFMNCEMLEEVYLPYSIINNIHTKKLQGISGMFKNCLSLKNIIGIDLFNTENVTSAAETFYRCENLTNLDLSNWNTEKIQNMTSMFFDCNKLTSVGNISNWKTDNVKYISNIFNKCRSLKDVGDLNKWNINIRDKKYKQMCFYLCPIKKPKWC